MDIIEKAKQIATEAHEGQFRKYYEPKQPYIVHPQRVAQRAQSALGYKPEIIAAAWAHDIFEDCHPKYRDIIAKECGYVVFNLVYELTNPSKDLKSPRGLRKAIDRQHLKYVSIDAKALKLIDRTDNLMDMAWGADDDFKKLYVQESDQLISGLFSEKEWRDSELVYHDLYYECSAAIENVRLSIKEKPLTPKP